MKMKSKMGLVIFCLGISLILAYIILVNIPGDCLTKSKFHGLEIISTGVFFVIFSIFVIYYEISNIKIGKDGVNVDASLTGDSGTHKEKEPEVDKKKRIEYQNDPEMPGAFVEEFKMTNELLFYSQRTAFNYGSASYILNADFKILDWNEAFSLAFDRTIEGRRGKSILDWIFYLQNAEEIIRESKKRFINPEKYPMVDLEDFYYNSLRYGSVVAHKIASQVHDETGKYIGWVITVDLDFKECRGSMLYFQDLKNSLEESMIWTDYTLSYDRLLESTNTYPELINMMIDKIPDNSYVLDLGAGTGNSTKRLLGLNKKVLAVDSNDAMLNILRNKCSDYLTGGLDQERPLNVLKQNCENLAAIESDQFDVVLLVNVLYTLMNPEACLKEAFRVLKSGGEVRISGPKKDTNLETLFSSFKSELKDQFESLRDDYNRVYELHKREIMKKNLHRFDIDDIRVMLKKVGFEAISYLKEDAYAGQAMIIFAKK